MTTGAGASPQKAVAITIGRSLLAVTVLIYAYLTLPLDLGRDRVADLVLGLVGLVVFAAIFVRQVRRIRIARFPVLRAVEALVMVATLFVVVVAAVHVELAAHDPSAYSEPLSRLDGLYFTVTVLATVGFGDITPVSDQARIFTTVQMVAGVALLGAGVRLLFSVANAVREDRRTADPPDGAAHDVSRSG